MQKRRWCAALFATLQVEVKPMRRVVQTCARLSKTVCSGAVSLEQPGFCSLPRNCTCGYLAIPDLEHFEQAATSSCQLCAFPAPLRLVSRWNTYAVGCTLEQNREGELENGGIPMPVNPTFPGVYIEEIPSGVRTITGVATSITAFAGHTLRGPTSDNSDKSNRAITINSYADFERIYGGLWSGSALSYAVRDFFLNGGSQAVVVRLYHPTFATDDEKNKAQTAAQNVANAATGANAQAAAQAADQAAQQEQASQDPAIAKTIANAVAKAADDAANIPGATADTVQRAAKRAALQNTAPDSTSFNFGCKDPINSPGQNPAINLVAAYPGSWGQYLRATIDFNTSSDMAAVLGV